MADTRSPQLTSPPPDTAFAHDRSTAVGASYSGLCIAGCARSRAWLVSFLRELGWLNTRGVPFTASEIDIALSRLIADGWVRRVQGIGFDVDEAPREEWLLEHLDQALMANAWRAWLRAQSPEASVHVVTPSPALRTDDERIALGRLLVYSTLDRTQFEAQRFHLGFDSERTLVLGLLSPFLPSAFGKIDPKLRRSFLEHWTAKFDTGMPVWRDMLDWLDARTPTSADAPATEDITPSTRLAVARRRAQAGNAQAAMFAVHGVDHPKVGEVLATISAVRGDWAEAIEGFQLTRKQLARERGVRQGLLASDSLRWLLIALLAQRTPQAWQSARKLCIAESGSRAPRPEGWGLWAHAIGCRLGLERLSPRAFTGPGARRGQWSDDDPDRLLLAAWLDIEPEAWQPQDCDAVLEHLEWLRQPCRADLVRQAISRLRLQTTVASSKRRDSAPPFFGSPREAWREALEAITRLAPGTTQSQHTEQPLTLNWVIELDDIGRVIDIVPHQRLESARGRATLREVPLSKVARAEAVAPQDALVARCIEPLRRGRSSFGIDVAAAVVALVGHPGVALRNAPDQSIELYESLPELEVRRLTDDTSAECFEFQLLDPIQEEDLPHLGDRWTAANPETEIERRNSIRVLPGLDGRARLLRITPEQRQVAELVSGRWQVPANAQQELDAALRTLAGHFQVHSDADTSDSADSDSRLRAQLTPRGNAMVLRLVVRPFGEFGPDLTPGAGRERTLTVHEGLTVSTRRNLRTERSHLAEVIAALPELDPPNQDEPIWVIDDPEQVLRIVERLPTLACIAGIDWPRGRSLRVTRVSSTAVRLSVRSKTDWFELQGGIAVDDSRVVTLQDLLRRLRENGSQRFIPLGEGEFLALTDQLRAQLSDLAALADLSDSEARLPRAAAALAEQILDGMAVTADPTWLEGLQRLSEASALQTPTLPVGLKADLRDYQRDGVAWLLRMAHAGLGAILADDMGLGKTVQTLALLLMRAAQGPALIVAPTSVCGNWVSELGRFAPSLRVMALLGASSGARPALPAPPGAGDVVVVSYALAMIEGKALAKRTWTTLVLDEAQLLKNSATQRGRAIAAIDATFRLALTGTPVENRLSDLWSIMNLLNPGLLGSSAQFSEQFAVPIERRRDERAQERLRRLISPFLLRRTKAQVLADLPERTEIVHRIEPGQREREFLEAIRRDAVERIADLDDGDPQQSFHVLAELTRLRRAACDPRLIAPELGLIGEKVQEFERLAIELRAGGHRALVFSQFTDFLDLLGQQLDQAGIAFQTLTGSTPAAERSKRIAAFQGGAGDIFLISLKAGGFGLNLTAADYVIIVDPWWNPAAEDQASGRAHRLGQQRPVTVYRLVTAGSIEEQIIDLHRRKRHLADGILHGQDTAISISASDWQALLSAG